MSHPCKKLFHSRKKTTNQLTYIFSTKSKLETLYYTIGSVNVAIKKCQIEFKIEVSSCSILQKVGQIKCTNMEKADGFLLNQEID